LLDATRLSAAVDVDNDADIDILCVSRFGILVLENDSLERPGLGVFTMREVGGGSYTGHPTDIEVLDYDLDGYEDVAVSIGDPFSQAAGNEIILYSNQPSSTIGRTFVDVTPQVGGLGLGAMASIAGADFNRDGFTDLMLTRQASSSFFFKADQIDGQPENSWLGVKLVSSFGANNSTGIGAKVQVEAGGRVLSKIVDGGSGMGGQRDPELVFGLGGYSGAVTITVSWPTGRTQVVTTNVCNQYVVVQDDSPVLDKDSVTFTRGYNLNVNKVDWVFTWETYNDCTPENHRIEFDLASVPARCYPPQVVLTIDSGVNITSDPIDGVPDKYLHTLVLKGVPCEGGCVIPFTLECGTDDYLNVYSRGQASIRSCIQTR